MAVFLWRPCGAKPSEQDREVFGDDGANQNDDVEKATATAATGGRETFGGMGWEAGETLSRMAKTAEIRVPFSSDVGFFMKSSFSWTN